MASERLYCMECVEGRPVALGLCADCLAGEPLEEVIRQIARLTRELEEARKLIRELVDDEDAGTVWTGTSVVCAYCSATDRYGVEHDRDCPIERARRALAKDTEGGYADHPAHPARMAQPDEEIAL